MSMFVTLKASETLLLLWCILGEDLLHVNADFVLYIFYILQQFSFNWIRGNRRTEFSSPSIMGL